MDFKEFLGVDFTSPLVIIAYVISTIGYIVLALAAARKRKSSILLMQSTANILCGISEILMYAWSGFVQDAINLLRNIFVLKKWMNKVISIIFMVLCAVVGIVVFILDFNHAGWWGLLPVVATLEYSLVIMIPNIKEWQIKCSIMVSSICWAVYGVASHIYTATIFNIISFTLALISLILFFVKYKRENIKMDETSTV